VTFRRSNVDKSSRSYFPRTLEDLWTNKCLSRPTTLTILILSSTFKVIQRSKCFFLWKTLTFVANLTFSVTQKQRRGRSKFCFLWNACLPWVPLPLTIGVLVYCESSCLWLLPLKQMFKVASISFKIQIYTPLEMLHCP